MSLRWYVVHTKPRQEDRVAGNLALASIEVFNPKLRKKRYMRGGYSYHAVPFFPCYTFARFDASVHYNMVKYTRGVRGIVGPRGAPCPIGDEIIKLIESRMDEDGFVTVGAHFKAGDKVEITEGPLKGFAGIFEKETKAKDRVVILLSTIGYQPRLEVERTSLKGG